MVKKDRIGSDPLKESLSWIKNTREEKKESKQDKQSIQDINLRTRSKREITKSSQEGLSEGWTRATFIVREELLEKLKALAYWERRQLKELVDEIFSSYLKGKKIKPINREGK